MDSSNITEWLSAAERLGDKTESILSAELFLLSRIAETSWDLTLVESDDGYGEFSEEEKTSFRNKHKDAVAAYNKWLADGGYD